MAASMFWQVKNGGSVVYLLGSVHVATPDYYPLPDVIESSFKRSDILVLEINPLSQESQKEMLAMQQKAAYAGNDNLENHLDRETYRLLVDRLQKFHLPIPAMSKLKPAILSVTLSMAKLATLGYTSTNGIDMYFLQKAGTSKPVQELESAKMQMDLLVNMPHADTFLRYTLDEMDNFETMMKKIDAAWKHGDVGYIEKLLIDDAESKYPELKDTNEKFLYQRNIGMADKIDGYLKSGKTYFVVVGTGHLVGPKGIIALLKKHGFMAQQL